MSDVITVLEVLEEHAETIKSDLEKSNEWAEFSRSMGDLATRFEAIAGELREAKDELVVVCRKHTHIAVLIDQAVEDKLRVPQSRPPRPSPKEIANRIKSFSGRPTDYRPSRPVRPGDKRDVGDRRTHA